MKHGSTSWDWLDLKKDIQFNSRVASAHYNEDTQRWLVTTDAGERIDTQYVIACLGMLSAPLAERFPARPASKVRFTTRVCGPRRGWT